MTRHIGDLGTVKPPIDLTFRYFGETFRVHPTASDLDLVEFMVDAGEIEVDAEDETERKLAEVKGMHALGRYLKRLVHPDEFQRFWNLSKEHGQGLTDILITAQSIMSAVADFPTGLPAASSGGQPNTPPKSSPVSSLEARRERSSEAALAHFGAKGRPDLQLMVETARTARQEMADAG